MASERCFIFLQSVPNARDAIVISFKILVVQIKPEKMGGQWCYKNLLTTFIIKCFILRIQKLSYTVYLCTVKNKQKINCLF